jgi:hypothetical protein
MEARLFHRIYSLRANYQVDIAIGGIMDPRVLLICAAVAGLYYGGKAVGHGAKVGYTKTKHAVVHVVTLGKK